MCGIIIMGLHSINVLISYEVTVNDEADLCMPLPGIDNNFL